ncbi:MAG: hypothetical protein CMK89_12550 [Pseudomonadales bacterium]|nr:hypothetical protein [Pseudomonadales bacterium]RLU02673.1 MAG: hypothetical protein D9N11_08030 [Ketobacter sp.]
MSTAVNEFALSDNMQAMRRQYQLGAINRATRQLISAHHYDDLLEVIHQLCVSLGLSGFLFLNGHEFRAIRKIATGLPRNQIRTLARVLANADKVTVDSHLFAFQYQGISLIVHHDSHANGTDLIQDDLVLFLDSADIWLRKHNAYRQTEAMIKLRLTDFQQTLLQDQKLLGSQRESIVNKMLTDMATIFPMLGLEPDQEEEIYNAVDPIVRAMSHALDNQASSNKDLCGIVEHLLQHLRGESAQAAGETEDIVLF